MALSCLFLARFLGNIPGAEFLFDNILGRVYIIPRGEVLQM